MAMNSVRIPYTDDILQKVQNDNSFVNRDPRYSKVGMGMEEKDGSVFLMIIYNWKSKLDSHIKLFIIN